ncbi:MAG: hypothetical protein GQF41_0380 [Candidatus Rifleibacterium amylolyticum]|nr:MAG: hypothetical protein GQF41_0380 [Candidatus Rifleibacterium amylolyticum]
MLSLSVPGKKWYISQAMKTDRADKIIRIIGVFCLLAAFWLTETVCFAQAGRAKTTEELIAEVEAESKKAASVSDSLNEGVKVKSAAEILAEIEALSTPASAKTDPDETEEDQENVVDEVASAVEELPVETGPLPDEVIGEYTVDEDEEDDDVAIELESEDTADIASAALPAPEETASETLYEKAEALEPQLMLAGTPVEEGDDAQQSEKISGRIIPEKKPITRRRYINRWVLKTKDGRRIPLKSNIKLLQEVRRDDILDSEVSLTGRYIRSGLNEKLRYFVVEAVVVLEDESDAAKSNDKDKKKAAAAKDKNVAAKIKK